MQNDYLYTVGSFSVIITAGGIGKRMKSSLPKQFILVKETPLLMYTIDQFYRFDPRCQIILTLPEEWLSYWEELCMKHDFNIPHRVIVGGEQRYHSIKNALNYCQYDIVAVHDGVRPLVSFTTLTTTRESIAKHNAVIPVIPVTESLRVKEAGKTKAVDRADYMIVQTPQWFKTNILREAYEQPFHEGITDDASLVEEAGYEIHTVPGNIENVKITEQSDLKFMELFLK